jgi:hypothetical protein
MPRPLVDHAPLADRLAGVLERKGDEMGYPWVSERAVQSNHRPLEHRCSEYRRSAESPAAVEGGPGAQGW